MRLILSKILIKKYNNTLEKSNQIDEIYTKASQQINTICGVDNDNSIITNINKTKIQIDTIYEKLSEAKNRILGYRKKTRGETLQAHQISGMSPDEYEFDGTRYYKIKTEVSPGIEDFLNEKIWQYKSFLQKDIEESIARNKKINEDIEALKQKIESHLPGATVAGLAFSYKESQRRQKFEIWIWRILFFTAITFMSYLLYYFITNKFISFEITDTTTNFIQILKIFSFEFPLIWLAIFSSKKVTQFTRLHEEYQHKRTIAETFEGIRRVIHESKNENLQEQINALFSAMLTSFSFNPSATLDKNIDSDSPVNSWFNILFKKDEHKNDKE